MRLITAVVFVLLLLATQAGAAVPVIDQIADASSDVNTTYTATPSLSAGTGVTWTKLYGHDDLTVNSSTGAISWAIPAGFPREAYYIGLKACNSDGCGTMTYILKVGGGNYIYVGPSDTYTTISAATAAAASGDTIVVRAGTYSGASNKMEGLGAARGTLPPSGSSGVYTTVMADSPGSVTLNGGTSNDMISIKGNYDDRSDDTPGSYNASYIAFKGFIVTGSNVAGGNGCVFVNHAQYIKFTHMLAYEAPDDTAPFSTMRSNYILYENCAGWGKGRMIFVFYYCDHVIMRRCVGRHDYSLATNPVGTFDHYSSNNGRSQNVIAVDSVISNDANRTGVVGEFVNQAGSSSAALLDNIYYNSIALNVEGAFTLTQANTGDTPLFDNCIGWGIKAKKAVLTDAGAQQQVGGSDDITISQCTFGDFSSPDAATTFGMSFNGWNGTDSITNSIIYKLRDYTGNCGVFYDYETASYCNIYDTGTVVVHGSDPRSNTITTNPLSNGLVYLPRIEAGSALATGGSGGARVGADLTYMRGKSGTLWGETGYDTVMNGLGGPTVYMWPFPMEDLIKTQMCAYNVNGVTGNRGFCAGNSRDGSSQTLTKYIWE
jgi:hypothetical protein